MQACSGPRGRLGLASALSASVSLLLSVATLAHAVPLLQSDYQSYVVGPAPRLVACGDLNGDGFDDAVVADADGVALCMARGDGTFEPARRFEAPANPGTLLILAGKKHQAARLGLVLRRPGSPLVEVDVYDHVDHARQTAPVVVTFGPASDNVVVGDLDGDGVLDLVAADGLDPQVWVAYGRKNGEFDPPVRFDVGFPTSYAFVGDVDGDGHTDLIALDGPRGLLSVTRNIGGRVFGVPRRIPTFSPFDNVALGDFNGDGRVDLALESTFFSEPWQIRTWYGAPEGRFVFHGITGGEDIATKLLPVDLNRDGKTDLVLGETPTAFLSRGDSLIGPTRISQGSVYVQDLASGDFDGDGRPDLAVVDGVQLGCGLGVAQPESDSGPATESMAPQISLHVWRGLGDGTFESTPTYPAPRASAPPLLADLDGDGIQDLVVGSVDGTAHGVTTWRGHADGTFDAPVGIPLDGAVLATAAIDLNREGRPKLAVSLSNSAHAPGDLAVLGLDQDRHLVSRADAAVGSVPRRFVVGDFNGDGNPDLVVANLGGLSLSVLLSGSVPGAWNTSTIPVHGPPIAIAAGDLNGDGNLDLAVVLDGGIYGWPLLRLYRGDGGGGFALMDSIPLPERSPAIRIRDVDQDGRPDLVLALSPSGCFDNRDMVRIYPNAGEFKFGDSVDTFMEAGPQDAEVADLTGDGVPDLIAVSGYGRVGVRPGLGGFRFGDLLRFGVPGIQPRGVLVADLDHDGRLDVVTNDEAAVHVLMNRGGESRRGVRGAVQPDAQAAIAPRASRLAATRQPGVASRGDRAQPRAGAERARGRSRRL